MMRSRVAARSLVFLALIISISGVLGFQFTIDGKQQISGTR
jgi:hypothetical protein